MWTFLELGPYSELSSFCLCVLQKFVAYSCDSQYVIFVTWGHYYFVIFCHHSNGCVGGPLNGYGLFGK